MDTIFMDSENSKTSDPQRLLLNLSDQINWKMSHKYVTLSKFSIYYTWKNMKNSYKNNKISAPTWNKIFELPEYIHKKHETVVDNPPVRIYVNKIKKTGLHLKLKYGIIFNL